MKKKLIFTIVLIALCMGGCKPREYQFPNKGRAIESIELLYNQDEGYTENPFTSIRMLETNEIELFMSELYTLQTYHPTPPPRNFGPYIAIVTYEGGDREVFSSYHIEFVEYGNEICGVGGYHFEQDAFDELFMEYAEKAEDGSTS